MPAEAERPGSAPRDPSARQARAPRRPFEEVLRDLEQERSRLVEAVDQLKAEARETRDRLLSARSLAIVGGALAALVVLRRRRKRR